MISMVPAGLVSPSKVGCVVAAAIRSPRLARCSGCRRFDNPGRMAASIPRSRPSAVRHRAIFGSPIKPIPKRRTWVNSLSPANGNEPSGRRHPVPPNPTQRPRLPAATESPGAAGETRRLKPGLIGETVAAGSLGTAGTPSRSGRPRSRMRERRVTRRSRRRQKFIRRRVVRPTSRTDQFGCRLRVPRDQFPNLRRPAFAV